MENPSYAAKMCGNIRVTVTLENSMGERVEEFAITTIEGCHASQDSYRDVMRAKVATAAEAAGVAICDRLLGR